MLLLEREVDLLLVTHPVNLRYLTGFTGTNGLALIAAGEGSHRFFTDFRYETQSAAQIPELFERRIFPIDLWRRPPGSLRRAARVERRAGTAPRPRCPAGGRPPRLRRGRPHRQAARAPARAPARHLGAGAQRGPRRGAARGQGTARDRRHPRRRGARRRGAARRPRRRARRAHRAGGRDRTGAADAPSRRQPARASPRSSPPAPTPPCLTPSRATRRSRATRSSRSTGAPFSMATALTAPAPTPPASGSPTRRAPSTSWCSRPSWPALPRCARDRTAKRSTPSPAR